MIVSRNDKRVKVPACGQHTKDTHTHTHTPWLANWSHLQLCKERAISTLHGIERCWLIQIHGILNFCPLYLCLKTVRHVARGDRVLVVRTSGLHSKPDLYVCVLEQVYCYSFTSEPTSASCGPVVSCSFCSCSMGSILQPCRIYERIQGYSMCSR